MLKKLSIKQMLVMIMVIPLIVVVLVSGKILYTAYESTQSLNKLDRVILLSTKIGALLHETQKERGMTAGYLGSKGKKFADKLPSQRELTNKRLKTLKDFLQTFDTSIYSVEFRRSLDNGLSQLAGLSSIRTKVTALDIPAGKAIGYYTKTNATMLDTISTITKLSTNYEVSQRVISYMNFLLSKERAGIERAVGTNTFARDNFASGMKAKFYTLVALQKAYMDSFLKVATMESKDFYKNTVVGKAVEEVALMRSKALGTKNENFGVDSGYWFGQITQKINLLKKVENYLAEDLLNTVSKAKNSATNSLTVFGIMSFVSILLTLVLARKIAFLIIVNVEKVRAGLDDFFAYINFEKDDISTLNIDSKDELGEMSRVIDKNIIRTKQNVHADQILIKDAIEVANQIKKGNLDVTIKESSLNPALHELKDIINEMLQALNGNINSIMKVLSSYSKFDYRPKIDSSDLEGVIKELENDVNILRESITQILTQNKQDGLVLNQNSNILSENMSEISKAANEQAASLEESAASLEEINSNLANSSETIEKMISYGAKVKDSVSAGNKMATQTAQSMEEINTQTTAITEAITVIDQIAFQTNILSLNAAVEAATAGEAGKGFAVVAGEVRNLASRSAEAAKEIKTLVENAQNKTNEGKDVATKMIDGYGDLNENITSTLELIENVATVSREQASGISQINDAINRLDQITQQNAHNANHADTVARKTEEIAQVIVQNADSKEFEGKNEVKVPTGSSSKSDKSVLKKSVNTTSVTPQRTINKKEPKKIQPTVTSVKNKTVITAQNDDSEWESF